MRYQKEISVQNFSNKHVILIGIVFMAISVFMIKNDIDTKNSMDSYTKSSHVTYIKKTETRRIDGRRRTKTTYQPVYHYTVDGVSYSCSVGSSSSFKSNANKKVYYKSYAPQSCFVEEGFLFKSVFFIMGLIAVIAGFRLRNPQQNI